MLSEGSSLFVSSSAISLNLSDLMVDLLAKPETPLSTLVNSPCFHNQSQLDLIDYILFLLCLGLVSSADGSALAKIGSTVSFSTHIVMKVTEVLCFSYKGSVFFCIDYDCSYKNGSNDSFFRLPRRRVHRFVCLFASLPYYLFLCVWFCDCSITFA